MPDRPLAFGPEPLDKRKGPSPQKEAPWSGWNLRQGSEIALSILGKKKKKKMSSFVNSRDVFILRRQNEALVAENEHHLEQMSWMNYVLPYPRTSSL